MILFDKAKSWLKLIKSRSKYGTERERSPGHLAYRNSERVVAKTHNLDRPRDGSPDPQTVVAINREWSQGSAMEEILVPDFQVEKSAQDYFNDNHGEQARGTFHEVEVIRWDHDEADWSIEEFEFELPASPAGRQHSKPPTDGGHNEPVDAVDGSRQGQDALRRLQALAVRRRWLAAVAALDRASQSAPLSKRERAAIEHVLNAATTLSRHRSDAEALRGLLLAGQSQVGEIDYRPPIAQLNESSAKPPAKDRNQPTRMRQSPSEAVSPTQEEIHSSVTRVRSAASDRGWLSPKSIRALEKLLSNNKVLSISESNALNYLIDRSVAVSELECDLKILRMIIKKGSRRMREAT
ncbi:hypothetical protein [Bosea sp. AS-1]|uniref:hypothetical protein n=1 Tax=Bosea sp. AS-1 TaxID=2015316 RepID=UPI0012FD4E02|nr:hypothetical protein [Bosea sp. AS-1]